MCVCVGMLGEVYSLGARPDYGEVTVRSISCQPGTAALIRKP